MEKPREVLPVLRETGCVTCGEYPGVQASRSACGLLDKAREGMLDAREIDGFVLIRDDGSSWDASQEARNLRGTKPKGL